MTAPQIAVIEPSKAKTWVAAIGGALTVIVPLLLTVATYLPAPWPAVIAAVIAVLTAFGVYKAPYRPDGTSVVSTSDLEQVATPVSEPPTPPSEGYRNPYRYPR